VPGLNALSEQEFFNSYGDYHSLSQDEIASGMEIARAVLLRVKYDTGGLGQWVHQLEARTARNKVIVAIANKLARIAWAVLFNQQDYRATAAAAVAA
jgi:hypothetical protein